MASSQGHVRLPDHIQTSESRSIFPSNACLCPILVKPRIYRDDRGQIRYLIIGQFENGVIPVRPFRAKTKSPLNLRRIRAGNSFKQWSSMDTPGPLPGVRICDWFNQLTFVCKSLRNLVLGLSYARLTDRYKRVSQILNLAFNIEPSDFDGQRAITFQSILFNVLVSSALLQMRQYK